MQDTANLCPNCGYNIMKDTHETLITDLSDDMKAAIMSGWGTDTFEGRRMVVVYIQDVDDPVIIQPEEEVLIGRQRKTTDGPQVLDLAPYGAGQKGVSRHHAVFRIDPEEGTLNLVDLGSKNGTFLNEAPLTPERPYVLHDGDMIRLGKLVMHIYFK